ncbi:hypothetical protein JW824_08605 [bacterium]|nr:hypothetical protein [bacterium]
MRSKLGFLLSQTWHLFFCLFAAIDWYHYSSGGRSISASFLLKSCEWEMG